MGRSSYLALVTLVAIIGYFLGTGVAISLSTTPVYIADPAPVLGASCGQVKRVLISTTLPSVIYCCAGGTTPVATWINCTDTYRADGSGVFTVDLIGASGCPVGSMIQLEPSTRDGGTWICVPGVPYSASCPEDSVATVVGGIWSCETPVTLLPNVTAKADASFVWDDMRVPLGGLAKSGVNAPDWVEFMDSTGSGGVGGVYAWGFKENREDDLVFQTQMPHGWAPGTSVEAHVHWSMTTTTVGVTDAGSAAVWWGLECAYGSIHGTFDVGDTSIVRAHTGYYATVEIGTGHKFELGSNITVVGLTETGGCTAGAYNGSFRVTGVTDTDITYFTPGVTCSEIATGDLGGFIKGYTITREKIATISENMQWVHRMTSFGTYRMTNCTSMSCVWNCRFYRLTAAVDIAETIPALEVDFHYRLGKIGSTGITVY